MAEDISREALLIYLDDVRTMETIIYESEGKKDEIEKREDALTSTYEEAKEYYDNATSKYDNAVSVLNAPSSIKMDDTWITVGALLLPISGLIALIGLFSEWTFVFIVGLISTIIPILCFAQYPKDKRDAESMRRVEAHQRLVNRDEAEKKKNELEAQTEQALSDLNEFDKKKKSELPKLLDDISSVKKMLQQAYNANIIPLQFRNIQGVYYLYDYISTSNQGLSEALMQCNLEAIKSRLDQVIELQGKAIVQQAQANAKLFQQNQQILETAQATMQNTYVAAKYAQISAVNSELSLKLQQKELAYQTVDFWLK